MTQRRIHRTLTGLAAATGLALAWTAAPFAADSAAAQKITKVKYAEVVRSVFYLPKYVAIAKGFFREQGIEVDMTTYPQAIEALQDILVEGGVLKADRRVKYDRIVTTKFSETAKKMVQ